ncbi:MAG: hypothetical protein F6K50_31730 [Moorea sp. SIO3I7]|uniref:hypothetical protein n=1 Tax=unclassified Moorena TaxID=2683338 RepID=UPI0013BFAD1D|nr:MULTISPECIES: hypothetical protein [unclassified Moorena]NEN99882.1 hypothetical protein [Moorena sp. SIO3I7]NEO09005.1 hypothetical protein [Moorena sp. SIO3I8]NEO22458.1 hypothetical protein [Moorena sp. SIO4A5]NEP23903.1 hypothetical protein [Moorena sp. SIO3I6]NEQ56556.1 hypothetical protein [Moorena sp. SIO4A1]
MTRGIRGIKPKILTDYRMWVKVVRSLLSGGQMDMIRDEEAKLSFFAHPTLLSSAIASRVGKWTGFLMKLPNYHFLPTLPDYPLVMGSPILLVGLKQSVRSCRVGCMSMIDDQLVFHS